MERRAVREECRLRVVLLPNVSRYLCLCAQPVHVFEPTDAEKTAERPVESYGAGYALSTLLARTLIIKVRTRLVV